MILYTIHPCLQVYFLSSLESMDCKGYPGGHLGHMTDISGIKSKGNLE